MTVQLSSQNSFVQIKSIFIFMYSLYHNLRQYIFKFILLNYGFDSKDIYNRFYCLLGVLRITEQGNITNQQYSMIGVWVQLLLFVCQSFASNSLVKSGKMYNIIDSLMQRTIILFAIFSILGPTSALQFYLHRYTINQISTTLTLPFSQPFTNAPSHAVAMQSLLVQQAQVSILPSVNSSLTNANVQIQVYNSGNNTWVSDDYIDIIMMWVASPYIEMQQFSLQPTEQTKSISFQKERKYNFRTSYKLDIFTLCLPSTWDLLTKDSIGFTIAIGTAPTQRVYYYVLVEKVFLAASLYVVFDIITQDKLHFVMRIGETGYVKPNPDNSFQPIHQLQFGSAPLVLPRLIVYYFMQSQTLPAIQAGYLPTQTSLTYLRSSFVFFNPTLDVCPASSYYSYLVPYSTLPQSCLPCSSTCLTCTSSQQDSTYTDFRFCTTCDDQRTLQLLDGYPFGSCECLKGLDVDSDGNCIPCQFDCLGFQVTLMKSVTSAIFLLTFTFSNVEFSSSMQSNLLIMVDGTQVSYINKQLSPGAYKLILQKSDLKSCEAECNIKFKFQYPEQVTAQKRYLTRQTNTLTIQDFFIIEDRLPQQLNQAMTVSSLLITASSSSGQAALIKMLFELEQVIEVHKYLNVELPVVFKEFVQALSNFRFMDVTTVISYDINEDIRKLSGSEMDCKGNPKIVYYENGANFFKNMVAIIVSFFIVVGVNILIFIMLRILPFERTKSISQKIRIRWVITLSQMLQTLIIPVSLYHNFQLSYTIPSSSYTWVYILSYLMYIIIFIFPFLTLGFLVKPRQKLSQIQIDILEDLLQDCKIGFKITYVFYLYGFLKKFVFGAVLAVAGGQAVGLLQGFGLIFVNIGHLLLICYIVVHRIYKSKIKILTRTINLICVIILEAIILGYNMSYNGIQQKILLGVTCTYLTLIATGIGLIQVVIKVFEVLFQRVSDHKAGAQERTDLHQYVKNKEKVIACGLGRQAILYNIENQQNSEQKSQIEYKDPKNENKIPDPDTIRTGAARKTRKKIDTNKKTIDYDEDEDEDHDIVKLNESLKTVYWKPANKPVNQFNHNNEDQKGYYQRDKSKGRLKLRRESQDIDDEDRNRTASTKGQINKHLSRAYPKTIDPQFYYPHLQNSRMRMNSIQAHQGREKRQSQNDELVYSRNKESKKGKTNSKSKTIERQLNEQGMLMRKVKAEGHASSKNKKVELGIGDIMRGQDERFEGGGSSEMSDIVYIPYN